MDKRECCRPKSRGLSRDILKTDQPQITFSGGIDILLDGSDLTAPMAIKRFFIRRTFEEAIGDKDAALKPQQPGETSEP